MGGMKAKKDIYAVILAGGRGERFWPVGRHSRPKQFVDLFEGKPLIAHAVDRLRGLVAPSHVLVITSADLVRATRKALPMLAPAQILGEPWGRDTAAACATASAWVASLGGENATVCILTADHLIADPKRFRETLAAAAEITSKKPVMSVIGIKPTFPATGYGYVETGSPVSGRGLPRGFRNVKRFVEKPNLGTATTYVESGRFSWNSGMFVWRAGVFAAALEKFRPALFSTYRKLRDAFGKPGFDRLFRAEYSDIEKISVDYAVMEKADNLVAARGDFGWDDVGTWVSAGAHFKKADGGNAVHGDVVTLAANGNTVANVQKGHVVALFGATDLVVVHTKDATLVCPKASADGLKALVKSMAADPAHAKFTR